MISICLAISAFYELIEWWVALLSGESAESFLGTQPDMALALAGVIAALVILGRIHDRQLRPFITAADRCAKKVKR
jgi:putative membrane protein